MTQKRINLGLIMSSILMMVLTACSSKEVILKGDSDVEGELNEILSLATDSLYTITFEKAGSAYNALTNLNFKADTTFDYKSIELTAAILDSDEDPLCELTINSNYGENRLIEFMRTGGETISVKFESSESLSDKDVDKIIERGELIRIIESHGVPNKTPEQIRAEQDSIARMNAATLELSDFLGTKRREEGFTGALRDLNSSDKVIAALTTKGFNLDKEYSVKAEEYDGGWTQMKCYELSRPIGSMTETVVIHEWPEMNIKIDFCDNAAAADFMANMTADGYRDGVSSDCYYAGTGVERKGKVVTLYQIWEP